jgi:hypothetical protein
LAVNVDRNQKVLKLLEKKYRRTLESTPANIPNNLDPSHTFVNAYVIPNSHNNSNNNTNINTNRETVNGNNQAGSKSNQVKSRPSTSSMMMERHQQQIQSNRVNTLQNQNNLHTYAPSTPSSHNAVQSNDTIETGKQQSYGGGFFYKSHSNTSTNNKAEPVTTQVPLGTNLTQRLIANLNMYTPLMNSTSNYNQAITLANKQKIRKNLTHLSSASKSKYLQVTKPISPLCRTISSTMSVRKEMSSLSEINNLLVAPPTPQSGIFKY